MFQKLKYLVSLVGYYHQYDTMIYPGIPKSQMEEAKSLGKRIKEAGMSVFRGLFGGSSQPDTTNNDTKETEASQLVQEDVFPVPEMEDMRKKCLDIYLTKYFDVFRSGSVGMSVSPDNLIRCVDHIYRCLYSILIHDGSPNRAGHTREWKYWNLKQVSVNIS